KHGGDIDILRHHATQHGLHGGDDLVQRDGAGREDLFTAECQQLASQGGGALAGLARVDQAFAVGIVRGQAGEQQIAIPIDYGEVVVEVVGHAAGEPPD